MDGGMDEWMEEGGVETDEEIKKRLDVGAWAGRKRNRVEARVDKLSLHLSQ